MKTSSLIKGLMGFFLLMTCTPIFAQESDMKAENRNVGAFTGISVGGVFKVYVEQSAENYLRIVARENVLASINTEVDDGVLEISTKNLKNLGKVSIYTGVPSISKLNVSGAAELETVNMLSGDKVDIEVSGAAEAFINLHANSIISEVSGASKLKLAGDAVIHKSSVSGASRMKSDELLTRKTEIEISGAASAKVNATDELSGTTSGASSLSYIGEPPVRNISKSGSAIVHNFTGVEPDDFDNSFRDSTKIKIGNLNIDVFEGDDSVRIKVGNNTLHVDEEGNVTFSHEKKPRFNGHWSGVDLGVNGYVNRNFELDFGKGYDYLDLNLAKSLTVNFNFYEKNFNLIDNQLGLVTGLGLECHNYRFDRSVSLLPDSGRLVGYYIYDSNNKSTDLKKSKLVVNYVTLPLIFEIQPMNDNNKKSFHFATGVILGARIASHTKEVFTNENVKYNFYHPDDTNLEHAVAEVTSPEDNVIKRHDDFYLNPFKVDATVRMGWGWLNLFGTYSLTNMFRENKGPELYPYSVGLTLSDW